MNCPIPSRPYNHFPSQSILYTKFAKWFESHDPSMGGSILGQMAEDVISEYDFVEFDEWIEYVYECSVYWANSHNIDC